MIDFNDCFICYKGEISQLRGYKYLNKYISHKTLEPHVLSVAGPQAAINAMNLEQQLSQYAFFNQQPSSQTLPSQQVSLSCSTLSTKADSYTRASTADLHSYIFYFVDRF